MAVVPCRKKWKSEMTDRERFINQMHYKPVDRCFNREFGFWKENFQIWKMFLENGIRNNNEADKFFNFDRMEGLGGNLWINPGFPKTIIKETDTTRIIMNELGLLAEVPKDDHETIPHFIKATIVTPDDWAKCKKERFRVDDPARIVDIEKLKSRHPEDRDYPLGVHCGSMIGRVRDMLTFEGLCYACYDYPEMVEDMVETSCVMTENYLDQVLPYFTFEYASGWEDICFNYGPIVSVDFFKNVVMPRYKRIGKKLREYGIDIWYTDCDGDMRPILPYFMEGGINTMFPFEVNSASHPAELLEKYGKELRILGGVDKMKLGQGREAIRTYLETLVPLVKRGGFIPFCDHRCPPNVKEEDYIYYLDLKEEMFGMK